MSADDTRDHKASKKYQTYNLTLHCTRDIQLFILPTHKIVCNKTQEKKKGFIVILKKKTEADQIINFKTIFSPRE